MGDVLNLRLARKKRDRQRKAENAAARRLFHSRDKSASNLDGHRIGSGEANEVAGRETIDRDSRT